MSPRIRNIINKQESPLQKKKREEKEKGKGKDLKQIFVIFIVFHLTDLRKRFLMTHGGHTVAAGTGRGFLNGSKREQLLEYENLRKTKAEAVENKNVS